MVHLVTYQACSAIFLVATVSCLRRRSGDRLKLTCLAVGSAFYTCAALMYFDPINTLLQVPHIACLLTQVMALVWNLTTVLLVHRWLGLRRGGPFAIGAALFAASIVALIVLFAALYPGPTDPNYLTHVGGRPAGVAYVAVYAGAMIATKMLLIYFFVSRRRYLLRTRATRVAVLAMIAGSVGIIGYSLCRLVVVLGLVANPDRWELLPTMLHTVGAVVYVCGLAFAVPVTTGWMAAKLAARTAVLRMQARSGRQDLPVPALPRSISSSDVEAWEIRMNVYDADRSVLRNRLARVDVNVLRDELPLIDSTALDAMAVRG